MPFHKRSKYFHNLVNKRWTGNVREENSSVEEIEEIKEVSCDPVEQNHLLVNSVDSTENESGELPRKKMRIQKKFDILSEEVNIDNNDTCEYLIIDIGEINILLDSARVKCANCNGTSLKFDVSNEGHGFSRQISLVCKECEAHGFESTKAGTYTSKRTMFSSKTLSPFDINVRMAAAFIYMGKGYAGIEQFSMFMNMHSFSQSTFDCYVKLLDSCIEKVTQGVLKECRSIVKDAYKKDKDLQEECIAEEKQPEIEDIQDGEVEIETESAEKEADNEKIQNIGVSYDGTWLTRGYKSKHGVGCVIDVETGFVIDFDIMLKYCQTCANAVAELGEDSPEYGIWQHGHADYCQKNHLGSSGAMEISVAEKIWKRSEEYGFRFTTMLSDGDSKTFNHLTDLHIYGTEYKIQKEECINHIGKRQV